MLRLADDLGALHAVVVWASDQARARPQLETTD